jgi:hypothetical protein
MNTFRVIDSHTAGEPTRTIVSGVPEELGNIGSDALPAEHSTRLSVKERLEVMRMKFDHYRRALVNEPRGSDVMVGALLVPPQDPANLAGVIFFNNVGYLGMCGHGTIGVVETLRYLGRMQPGRQTLETCVGPVHVRLHEDHRVTVENVPSYRVIQRMPLSVEGLPALHADIAWGGNSLFEKPIRKSITWNCLVLPRARIATPGPLSYALAVRTIVLRAAREPAPNSHAWPPTRNSNPKRFGVKRVTSAAASTLNFSGWTNPAV